MKDLEEQCVCVKFCFKLGKTATETWKMFQQAFRDECMSRTQCFEWYSHFKTGRTSIEEDPRSGRPSTSTGDVHINAVHDFILQIRRLTIREIAEDVGISFGSCQAILTKKLNMHHVTAKFVPRVLTKDRKANRVNISQELLDHVSVDENFLKTIITGKTWVYGYDVETKAQSSQWVGQGSPRPRKARMSQSNMKVMLVVFFDWQGVIHYKFVPRGQTVNKEFYVPVLKHLREAVRRKRPQLWTNQSWVLQHDNAPAHSLYLVHNFLAKNETTVVPQPPYSPDLAPADFFLFPKLKCTLKGRCLDTFDEIQKNSTKELFTIPKEAFQSWQKRWEQCVASEGNYFEGDKLE